MQQATQELIEIANQSFTLDELKSKFELPDDVEIVGKNAVSTSSDDFIKKSKAKHFFYCFSLDGFSSSTYNKVYELLVDMHPANLFNINIVNEESLRSVGLGPTQASKFMLELDKHRNTTIPYTTLLDTLAIDGCGRAIRLQYANKLSGITYSFDSLTRDIIHQLDNSTEDLETTKRFLLHFANISISKMIEQVAQEISEDAKTYVLTGSPKDFGFKTKADFQKLVPNWIEIGKVDKADFLILSDTSSTSSKTKCAIANNIKMITYAEAIEIYNKY